MCSFFSVSAQVHLPNFFSDHMVLQRNENVNIWGWCKRGSSVKIIASWSPKDTVTVPSNAHAKWSGKLKTPEAGGPYTIQFINAGHTTVLKDILIGEVWLGSGQSNMEWGAQNKLKEMLDEIPKKTNPAIRVLQVNRIGSDTPQENIFNSWELADSNRLKEFSAIGYFYAQKLNQELNVPIGIIHSSWGGTNAEVWTAKELILNHPDLLADAKKFNSKNPEPIHLGILWNAMIHPLKTYTMAGVLWYQGESNVSTYKNYNLLMSTMIENWRKEWKAELPFYFVQIAPHTYKQSTPEEQKAALLREQQEMHLKLPKTGMVVVSDLVPDVKDIHPPYKREVANRLADIALSDVYGRNLVDKKSPLVKNHEIKNGQVIISFEHASKGLKIKGDSVRELYIAGEDLQYKEAKFTISGNKLTVFHPDIKKPVYVKYNFTDSGIANLFNTNDLPVAPFRVGK
jgi:sialate O-acetylesterase